MSRFLERLPRVNQVSPFSEQLRALRLRYGIRQTDLAEAIGFEQSYVAAIELGTKGPPSIEFVKRVSAHLRLSVDEDSGLREALHLSRRNFSIPQTASAAIFRLYSELWCELDRLVVAGLPNSAEVWKANPQLTRRFSAIHQLRRFDWMVPEDR